MPQQIISAAYASFNCSQEIKKNKLSLKCQICNKEKDEKGIMRCQKCFKAHCKYCLGDNYQIDQNPHNLFANDITVESILKVLDIKFE